jgi:3-phenylpropionate/trans-cinnamate dioxygenase ferredoxin reductase subunit
LPAAITLLGDEPTGPYHRPPLSKAWLAGDMDASQLAMRAQDVLAKKDRSTADHAHPRHGH